VGPEAVAEVLETLSPEETELIILVAVEAAAVIVLVLELAEEVDLEL
jgi:hypothetical protein